MNRLKNNKLAYIILAVIIVLLVSVGITYALWIVTKSQTGENQISSACLKLELNNEANDITLSNQFPISDEAGMKSTPYTFTITNKCNTSLDYQVALESIGDEATALQASSLKVALNDSISLLSNKLSIDATIDGAYASNRLAYGTLAPKNNEGSSVTYNLRIWIDYYAPNSEQNKTFTSKISVTTGQNITNPYKEGTLAYDILSNYGGANAISEIDPTELFETTTTGNSVYVIASTSYYYGTSYAYDESTGKYTLSGTLTQATLTECRNGTKSCGKYTLRKINSTSSTATLYEITDFKTSGNYVTANTTISTNEFGKTANVVTGLYKTLDDYGDSYYFRGDVENNYVQFGKFAETEIQYYLSGFGPFTTAEECESMSMDAYFANNCYAIGSEEGDKMYWRIVRINGDGTIRLAYDGNELVENGVAHTSVINGGECGTQEYKDSTSKTILDTWYSKHLNANYNDYISDSIFCNDTEEISRKYYDEYLNEIPEFNSEDTVTEIYYGASKRLRSNPKLTCTQDKDKYTIGNDAGNGLMTYPIGLITADEVQFAGTGNNNYLYSSQTYLTLTPYMYFDFYHGQYNYGVISGSLNSDVFSECTTPFMFTRPVINLKVDVPFTYNSEDTAGTINDPYVIVTE